MAVHEVVYTHSHAPYLAAIMVPTLFEGRELVLKVVEFLSETPHLVFFSDLLKRLVFVEESYYAQTNRLSRARWPNGQLSKVLRARCPSGFLDRIVFIQAS
jgi:hypothetical protein